MRPYRVYNESGMTIPSFSIVRIKQGGSTSIKTKNRHVPVERPTSTDGSFLTIGPTPISDGEHGHGNDQFTPSWVKYSGDAPSIGDEVGPSADEFTVSGSGSGFIVWDVDATNTLVFILGMGGGGVGETLTWEYYDIVYDYGGSRLCDRISAVVDWPPCSGSPAEGDIITVWDSIECTFDVPEDLLDGTGTANAVAARGIAVKQMAPYGHEEAGNCIWVVAEMCCDVLNPPSMV